MAPAPVIDFHVHVFPDPLDRVMPLVSSWIPEDKVGAIRRTARHLLSPVTSSVHQIQVFMRHLPEVARRGIDQIGGASTVPRLLIESNVKDLTEAMENAGVHQALVLAHPPFSSNEFVLETCQDRSNLIPVVNLPHGTFRPGATLKSFYDRGARALKIHPAADGKGADSAHYHALLASAADLGIPVILHTGCIHNAIFYKDPQSGHAERFAPWFEKYRQIQFVLAHMNFHHPNVAMDLAQEHPNVHLDTSWQPAEIIGEAVRRVGAEKVLFGTDWPLVGDNMAVGIARIQDCVAAGTLSESDSQWVLGGNAARLLKFSPDADSL